MNPKFNENPSIGPKTQGGPRIVGSHGVLEMDKNINSNYLKTNQNESNHLRKFFSIKIKLDPLLLFHCIACNY